jgi:hypothetical protein
MMKEKKQVPVMEMLCQGKLVEVQVEHQVVQQCPQRQQPHSASCRNRCNRNAPRHFRVTTAAAKQQHN